MQRAELLADLGRYDEALAELAPSADPADAAAQTLLARLRLATGARAQALAAADAAVAAAPNDLAAQAVRGRALIELGRVDEAVTQAEQLLRAGRGEPFACTSAAAILAEARAGQVALDAAWEGVRLAPEEPSAHLVLGVVALRLGLDRVAERAYQEALVLDPQLPDPPAEAGLLRLEQQRFVAVLSRSVKVDRPHTDPRGPGGARPGGAAAGGPGEGRGSGAVPGLGGEPAAGEGDVGQLRRLLRRGALLGLAGSLLVGWAHVADAGGPLVAVLLAGLGVAMLVLGRRRLPEGLRADLPARLQADRALLLATWALLAVPMLLFLYGLFGAPWLIGVAVVAAAGALLVSRPGGPAGS